MDLINWYQTKSKPLLLLLLILIAGLFYIWPQDNNDEIKFSSQEVIKSLNADSVILIEKPTINDSQYMVMKKMPKTYAFNNSKSELMLYEFDSPADRIEAGRIWAEQGADNGLDLFFAEGKPLLFYIYNILLVYRPDENYSQVNHEKVTAEFDLLQKITYSLNDAAEIKYYGHSIYWEATITEKYYEHWVKDKSGSLYRDGYATSTGVLTYRGSDTSQIGAIDYTVESTTRKTSAKGMIPDKNGNFHLNIGSGYGSVLPPDIIVTVNWKGEQEIFTLLLQKSERTGAKLPALKKL